MKNKNHTVIDLFSGAGGITEGFKWAGFDVLASLELDHDACETHRANHPDTKVIEGDITSSEIKKELAISVCDREIDVVVGGPPCQGFSLVGTRLGTNKRLGQFIDDPRNLLYKEFVKIVKKHKPKIFIMENVPGLFSYKKGLVKNQIISDFENLTSKGINLGYKVDVRILNSADYGVPQLRNRVIFIGNSQGVKNSYPEEINYNPDIYDTNDSQELLFDKRILYPDMFNKTPYLTLNEAISDLPFLKAGEGINEKVDYSCAPESNYQNFMRDPSLFIKNYDLNIKRGHNNIKGVYNHQCRYHNELDIRRYEALDDGQIFTDLPHDLRNGKTPENFKDSYRKLDSNRPSYTIVAHLYKDGNAFIHPDKKQARTLTVREAARIQSFPDDYFFCTSRTSQFKQVGNAVPPLLAYHIALATKEMLRKGVHIRNENQASLTQARQQ